MSIGLGERTREQQALLERATYVYRQKNMTDCAPEDVIVECLATYLQLYEWKYGPPDPLSQMVVYGPRHARTPVADLDEVARLLVRGGVCKNCGKCCRNVIGVRVSEEEIQEIEKLGYAREEFLDEDGLIRTVPGHGCYFLVIKTDGTARCRIYGARPQICKAYFCGRNNHR